MPAAGGDVYHVYPPGFKGAKIEPAFEGLMCAYNLTCAGTDWATAGRPRVKAGRHHPRARRRSTSTTATSTRTIAAVNRTMPLDGTYYLTANGTAEKPIVIKGAGDGEAIFDGDGNFALFDVKAADYTYFEGLTFRNTDIAIWAGTQFIAGVEGPDGEALPVRGRRRRRVHELLGLEQLLHRRQLLHRPRRSRITSSAGRASSGAQFDGVDGQKFPPVMASYIAVKVYGPGHVVAYNYVANFHDGIDIETYGNPDGSAAVDGPNYPPQEYWDRRPVAIDFYNNYMTNFHDNPFETDGSMHNVRVHAEHDDQLRVARVLQPAGDRRAGVLDPATSPITCRAGRRG